LAEMNPPDGGSGQITWYQSGVKVTDPETLSKFESLLSRAGSVQYPNIT
jgi:hypothetical protein